MTAKSDKSAGSDMRSGSQPSKLKLMIMITFADAVVAAPTPEEKKAQEQVEALKQRNKKQGLEAGSAGKQKNFVLRPTYDAIGRELISLAAATLRAIGKQDAEPPTKADRTMPLPLAQKRGKVFGHCASKQVRTELMEGLGDAYGFHIAHMKVPQRLVALALPQFTFQVSRKNNISI